MKKSVLVRLQVGQLPSVSILLCYELVRIVEDGDRTGSPGCRVGEGRRIRRGRRGRQLLQYRPLGGDQLVRAVRDRRQQGGAPVSGVGGRMEQDRAADGQPALAPDCAEAGHAALAEQVRMHAWLS